MGGNWYKDKATVAIFSEINFTGLTHGNENIHHL
jgi:hypothetical protein